MGKKIQNKKNNVFTFQVMGLTYKVVEYEPSMKDKRKIKEICVKNNIFLKGVHNG